MTRVAVLGAGPAGAAAALGLRALDFAVTVFSLPRRAAGHETFGARAVESFARLGLDEALGAVQPPGARRVSWAGEVAELPGPSLVDRAAFDAALVRDLARRGVASRAERVASVRRDGERWRIALHSGCVETADFVVEARGRRAPHAGRLAARGPETLCLLQSWRVPRGAAWTGIHSLSDGWLWLADDGSGRATLQLAVGASARRRSPPSLLDEALREAEPLAKRLAGGRPAGATRARAATALLHDSPCEDGLLRIGDAAAAIDPLSGQGVFHALTSALVAPAVVRTLLERPHDAGLARAFFEARVRETFARAAETARAFYARVGGGPFWEERAAWPRARAEAPAELTIAERPVVADHWIERRRVVLTRERPLGLWHVAGVELAPLVERLRASPHAPLPELVHAPASARRDVLAWLARHGVGPEARER